MGIIELVYGSKTYTTKSQILRILRELEFYWLIDSEVEGAKIEIKNNTLIWHEGIFMSSNWHYGIFKNGGFYGRWENGIWEGGYFDGEWISGIVLNKK
jgi:hypothetical protein